MFRALAFLVCLACPVLTQAQDACDLLGQQIRALSHDELQMLKRTGFVYALDLPSHLPSSVVSGRVVGGCVDRLAAEKYFDNSIAGERRFEIGPKEFARARAPIARAACAALAVSEPWPDGVSHEIFNIVSDELLPEWLDCLYAQFDRAETAVVALNYFTPGLFEHPPHKLLGPVRGALGKRNANTLETALLLFLEKNITGNARPASARKALLAATPMRDTDLSNEEIIERTLRLLAKPSPITRDDAWILQSETYGSWD